MSQPVTKCGACGQADDHPKHQVAVGVSVSAEGRKFYDEHDFDHNGVVAYHFDCDTPWHDLHSLLATEAKPDEGWPDEAAADARTQADIHAATIAQAKSGVHGDDLRQWINNLNQRGGAGGMDQTIGTALLTTLTPNSGTKTLGSKTITGPINCRFMTANGTDSSNGTELGTGGGYTAGTGVAMSFGTAAADSVSSNAAASITNMPSCTLTGGEFWDSSGTPQRTYWFPWNGGPITVGSGNTFTIPSGNATITQS